MPWPQPWPISVIGSRPGRHGGGERRRGHGERDHQTSCHRPHLPNVQRLTAFASGSSHRSNSRGPQLQRSAPPPITSDSHARPGQHPRPDPLDRRAGADAGRRHRDRAGRPGVRRQALQGAQREHGADAAAGRPRAGRPADAAVPRSGARGDRRLSPAGAASRRAPAAASAARPISPAHGLLRPDLHQAGDRATRGDAVQPQRPRLGAAAGRAGDAAQGAVRARRADGDRRQDPRCPRATTS